MDFHHKFILGCATIGAAVAGAYCAFLVASLLMPILASVAVFGGICALGYGIDVVGYKIWGQEEKMQDLLKDKNAAETQKKSDIGTDRQQEESMDKYRNLINLFEKCTEVHGKIEIIKNQIEDLTKFLESKPEEQLKQILESKPKDSTQITSKSQVYCATGPKIKQILDPLINNQIKRHEEYLKHLITDLKELKEKQLKSEDVTNQVETMLQSLTTVEEKRLKIEEECKKVAQNHLISQLQQKDLQNLSLELERSTPDANIIEVDLHMNLTGDVLKQNNADLSFGTK